MDFDRDNVRPVIGEDRLSSLPDELIHQILSCFDSKFAVQTCLLSSRWKLLWTSMPYLNFSSWEFGSLPKFAKFVTNLLSHRNNQIEVTSVNLDFQGAASQVFVRKIANYAFSHNVQELTVVCKNPKNREFPPCLFSSPSLKHFSLTCNFMAHCLPPKTPWNFPALTSLHLRAVRLCGENSQKSFDIFSKCVNLKNLTLECCFVDAAEGLDIITPQLSNLTIIDGKRLEVVNLVAPKLENLTVMNCSIKYLNAPAGLSSLCYRGYHHEQPHHVQLSKEGFHSLNKVTICVTDYCSKTQYKEEDARRIISMLQEVHSARFLTLNIDIVECLSSFPDLLSHHPSPFSNLICLNIDAGMRKNAYKVNMPTEARNFLLENSPNATFIMDLPEAPPTKAIQQKEARAKRMAKLVADVERYMKDLQASLDVKKTQIEKNKQYKSDFQNLMVMAELRLLTKQKTMQFEKTKESAESHNAKMQMEVDQREVQTESEGVLASQPSSSSSAIIPTPSTSNTNSMP